MKRKNHLSRALAWLLVLAMTVCMLPSVTAVSTDTGATAPQGTSFEEVTALREEKVKHFSLGDGAYQAVVYGHPVHYQDENGAWQDIDNRLTLQTVKGVQQYATADSRVAFAPSYRANTQLLGLRNGEYSLSMGLKTQSLSASVMALNETAQISAAVTNPQLEITNLEQAQAADWSSTVVYEGVLPNVDLEYIVEYDYIKENIIVNAPSAAYEYAFTLELDGMYAELLGDGSVGIYCSKTEEEKYTIPAPYMYDANGKLSMDVAYTLTGTAGNYTLTVCADASWINSQNRAFPVTIDPSFVVSTGVPLDTYINANRPTINFSRFSTLWVSEDEITYIDPVSDITLPDTAILDYAALTVFYFYPDGAEACDVDVGAYQVTSFWGESTATWNSMSALPNFGMSTTCSTWETADSEVGATISAPKQLDFFITDIMENWMEGDAQRGVALKYECGDGLSVGFLSYEAGYDYRPGITYRYRIPDYVYSHQYDSTFGARLDLIPEAVTAANAAFTRQFEITFATTGTPQLNSNFADACPYGINERCDELCEDRGEDRGTYYHHKNLRYISDTLYASTRAENEIIVFWTDHEPGVYCYHYERDHMCPYDSEDDTVIACVARSRPVIQIMNIVPDGTTNSNFEACMGITLIHETAHAFGLKHADIDTRHSGQAVGYCAMMNYDTSSKNFEAQVQFYQSIKDGAVDAFCAGCAEDIRDQIYIGLMEEAEGTETMEVCRVATDRGEEIG